MINNIEMPKAIQSETSVLGAMIAFPRVTQEVVGFLAAKDFYSTKHNIIYNEFYKLYNDGITADIATLAQSLQLKGKLMEAGGASYLAELLQSATVGENIKYHCDVIKDMAVKRKIIDYGKEIIRQAYSNDISSENVISNAANELYNINEVKEDFVPMPSCITESLEAIDERRKNEDMLIGKSTGYKKLDIATGGLQKGDFIIIAGRPSMGKTTFALNIADNASKNCNVAVFSFEMSKTKLIDKIISKESNVLHKNISRGNIKDDEFERIAVKSTELERRSMWVYDGPALTTNDINIMCKKLKIKEGIDVVVIDYLQLIIGEGNYQNVNYEISKISAALKRIAKELDITLIVLSQLSRGCETRQDHRPILSDLRDSGSLEQDGDIIAFLYREAYYYSDSDIDENRCDIIIQKNRNGETGTIPFLWFPEYQRFVEK